MRWLPKGYGGERRPADEVKREGWHEQGILVIAAEDGRLTWPERELVKRLARNSTDRGPPNRGRRVAKRRKHAAKGKARAQRAKPEAMRLPGGRTLETVRVTDPEGRPGHPCPHRRHAGAHAQGRDHHARHAPGRA